MNRTLRQGMPFLSFGVPYIFAYLFGLFHGVLCFQIHVSFAMLCLRAIPQVTYCYPLIRTIAGAEKTKQCPIICNRGIVHRSLCKASFVFTLSVLLPRIRIAVWLPTIQIILCFYTVAPNKWSSRVTSYHRVF